jgi:Ran GTPase-activating protein (RanGAP) involved in mRNA processing and transport
MTVYAYEILLDGLSLNATIETLSLSYRYSILVYSMGNFIATNKAIKTLELARNDMSMVEIVDIASGLKHNTSIRTLDLSNNPVGNVDLSDALKTNMTLENLILNHCDIGDEGAKALAKSLVSNTGLLTVDLRFNKFGNEGKLALSQVSKHNPFCIITY